MDSVYNVHTTRYISLKPDFIFKEAVGREALVTVVFQFDLAGDFKSYRNKS